MNDLITVEWCRNQKCYNDRIEIIKVIGDGMSPLQILDINIPSEEKVWAVSQWLLELERMEFLRRLLRRMFTREQKKGRSPNAESVVVLTSLENGRWPTDEERYAVKRSADAFLQDTEKLSDLEAAKISVLYWMATTCFRAAIGFAGSTWGAAEAAWETAGWSLEVDGLPRDLATENANNFESAAMIADLRDIISNMNK